MAIIISKEQFRAAMVLVVVAIYLVGLLPLLVWGLLNVTFMLPIAFIRVLLPFLLVYSLLAPLWVLARRGAEYGGNLSGSNGQVGAGAPAGQANP